MRVATSIHFTSLGSASASTMLFVVFNKSKKRAIGYSALIVAIHPVWQNLHDLFEFRIHKDAARCKMALKLMAKDCKSVLHKAEWGQTETVFVPT
jgi:hypothetical protein